MKFLICVLSIFLLPVYGMVAQDIYATQTGVITFFAEAPISDVDARNDEVNVELNASTQALTFDVTMADFQFENNMMGRDAEGKYIEIEKYPKSHFEGKINDNIDFNRPGKYPVTATGVLEIHGTEREVTKTGTVIVHEDQVILRSDFYVLLSDYNIETPNILGIEMTEDEVLVKVDAALSQQTDLAKEEYP